MFFQGLVFGDILVQHFFHRLEIGFSVSLSPFVGRRTDGAIDFEKNIARAGWDELPLSFELEQLDALREEITIVERCVVATGEQRHIAHFVHSA